LGFTLVLGVLALGACGQSKATPTTSPTTPPAGMPTPASVYCEQQGGKLEIRTDSAGGQYGVCIFSDGSECDEWAYFRGECSPGQAAPAPTIGMANPASVFCTQQGYRLEMRTGSDGGQYGVCIFPDGSECEEWSFFRGECGQGKVTPGAGYP